MMAATLAPSTGAEPTTAPRLVSLHKPDTEREAIGRFWDALVIPGGHSPDTLRMDEDLVGFIRRFGESGRPIAAICHGPQLLIEADLVRGRTVTSWPSIRKDLENAGARWVDREVVVDGNLVTSRKPDDLPAFEEMLIGLLGPKQPEAHA